jgi:prepilin-type N-terminal cleavage/methylation domain-containing protein
LDGFIARSNSTCCAKFLAMKKNGYTLVELIVTMSIVAVFTAVVLPGFGRQRPEQALEQTALAVRSTILQARSLAMAPQTQHAGKGINCYSAKVGTDGKVSVGLWQDHETSGECSTYIDDLKGYDEKLDGRISPPTSDYVVKFRVGENKVYGTKEENKILELSPKDTSIDRTATISVNQYGYVSLGITN